MAQSADRSGSLAAYPTLSQAARLLGISPSTLSRRRDVEGRPRGDRDTVLLVDEVMCLAYVYRKRSVNEVAADLLVLAEKQAPTEAARVEAELHWFFERDGWNPSTGGPPSSADPERAEPAPNPGRVA